MLTFPAGYTAADLDLARAVERELGLGDVHVFWTAAPAGERAPASPTDAPRLIASVLIVVDALVDALGALARGAGRSSG